MTDGGKGGNHASFGGPRTVSKWKQSTSLAHHYGSETKMATACCRGNGCCHNVLWKCLYVLHVYTTFACSS